MCIAVFKLNITIMSTQNGQSSTELCSPGKVQVAQNCVTAAAITQSGPFLNGIGYSYLHPPAAGN